MSAFSLKGARPESAPLSRELFLSGIEMLQEGEAAALEADREKAAHYVSLDLLHEHSQRHVPAIAGPSETFIAPMTASHDAGWRGYELSQDPRHPKRSCAETKFMALLAASGYL